MDYDVLVLGGGIIGCAAAYELSKYNLNIAVIEKEYDIADDISFVNTAIVYDGSETSNNVMSGLEYIGNILLEDFHIRQSPFWTIHVVGLMFLLKGLEHLE